MKKAIEIKMSALLTVYTQQCGGIGLSEFITVKGSGQEAMADD